MISPRLQSQSTRLLMPELYLRNTGGTALTLDAESASRYLYDAILADQPFFVGRFGSTELLICCYFLIDKKSETPPLRYNLWRRLQGGPFPPALVESLCIGAGFFPTDTASIEQFAHVYLDAAAELDVLASWMQQEDLVRRYGKLPKDLQHIPLEVLAPFTAPLPWTQALEGKRVLVIHPFATSIKQQYQCRELLFADPRVLPDFDLQVLPAVQSAGGSQVGYSTWFEALDYQKEQIATRTFDVAIIGAGAYGLPLGAFVKSLGKQALHLGGVTQCLFGIKGRRWADDYHWDERYFNEYWVWPREDERPTGANAVENACYWGPEVS